MATDGHEDDILDDIYQGEVNPVLEGKKRRDFQAWHRPRKHFIRIHQWCAETRRLIKDLKLNEKGVLSYLGLPGEDLLDIRVLKGVCTKAKVALRYLGYDRSLRSPVVNLARHEINSDQVIHAASCIYPDDLDQLGKRDTVAFQNLERHAPFDVINLDLCGGLTDSDEPGVVPYLEALRTICDLQIERRPQPWLCFLTTRAIRKAADTEVLQKLFERLLVNIQAHASFAQRLSDSLGLSEQQVRQEMTTGRDLELSQWVDAYALSIAKWLLHYMANHDYKIAVKLLKSYRYSVHNGAPDMLSLAFELAPAGPAREDPSGLTQPRKVAEVSYSESDLAEQIVQEIASIEDLDSKLKGDRELELKMFTKSSKLLESLRYDVVAYERFCFPPER